MLFSSFSTRSMVFAYFAKAQLPFSLFRDLFNDTAEFTLCYGLHDCSHLFQGYFIHSLSTLYYYNAPSLTTRLTGDYRDRTYTGKCSPALLDTRRKKAGDLFQISCLMCRCMGGGYLVVEIHQFEKSKLKTSIFFEFVSSGIPFASINFVSFHIIDD